jgi:hypothetical protein
MFKLWLKILIYIMFFSMKSNAEDSVGLETPSVILVPAFSYFIPGLGSFLEQDYKTGTKFMLYGLSGLGIYLSAENRIDDFLEKDSSSYHHYRDLQRESGIGQMMLGHSMMLSTYDSFLSRTKKLQNNNEYTFLPANQNIESVLSAPFKFEYLKRWTTYIPFALAIFAGTNTYNRNSEPEKFELRPIDGLASSYTSYVAGTGEEAFFRGWMYPVLYQNTNSHIISNLVQGTAFGYAHGPQPYFQLAFGFYAGWLNERNNFDLGEAIFVHAWWDFWVIAAEYARSRSFTRDYNIQLPPLQLSF